MPYILEILYNSYPNLIFDSTYFNNIKNVKKIITKFQLTGTIKYFHLLYNKYLG